MKKTVLIFALLAAFKSIVAVASVSQKAPKIQVALLLDTSNSMDGLIDQTKAQLWKMVNHLIKAKRGNESPVIEIALYEYGNSNLVAGEGYLRMVNALTTDVDDISEKLFALSTKGGEEFCGWVIRSATTSLAWSESNADMKIIFIAGNEPFNQGPTDYRDACTTAQNKSILINTIFCGNWKEGVRTHWQDGASLGKGLYFNIDKDRKIEHIPTPYDDTLFALNRQLNETYIAYGKHGESKLKKQTEQDVNAANYGKANVSLRTSYKAKGGYRNESWDLIDASEQNPQLIETLKVEDLPEKMRSMSTAERKKYIGSKQIERSKIKKQIIDIDTKMQAFLLEKMPKSESTKTLDKVMLEGLTTQLIEHGFEIQP